MGYRIQNGAVRVSPKRERKALTVCTWLEVALPFRTFRIRFSFCFFVSGGNTWYTSKRILWAVENTSVRWKER